MPVNDTYTQGVEVWHDRFLWIVAGLIEASLNKVIVESRIFLSSSVIQWWEPTNTWFGSFKNKPKQECGKCSVIKKAKLFGMYTYIYMYYVYIYIIYCIFLYRLH